MKQHLLSALLGFAALASGTAHAVTATGNFNVAVTLTSACALNTPSNGAMAYTALATSNASATAATINVQCTNTLPYTATLNGAGTTTSNVYTFTDTDLDLTYKLTLSATGLGAADGKNIGTGANQAYTITPSVDTAQGGKCATATCSKSIGHTLTITY